MPVNVVSFNQPELFHMMLAQLCYPDTTQQSFCTSFGLFSHTKQKKTKSQNVSSCFNFKGDAVPLAICEKDVTKNLKIFSQPSNQNSSQRQQYL